MSSHVDVIRNLLELSKRNDNVNEAAAAFKQAQKLMEKHRISEATIEESTQAQEEEIENDILFTASGLRLAWWKQSLARSLAEVNGCKTYSTKSRADKKSFMQVIGEPNDASTVRYMYNYIANEIDRLAEAASVTRGRPGKTWCNSFRHGAVAAISERLKEAHEEARAESLASAGNTAAIVRVSSAIAKLDAKLEDVHKWAKKNLKLVKTSTRSMRNDDATKLGRRAGKNVNLSSDGKALGSGVRGYLT